MRSKAVFDRPFTWREAQAAGLTKHQLRSAAYRHVFREVWAPAELPDTRETRVAAARLILPGRAVACGLTAAWLFGVDVRRQDDLDMDVGCPKGGRIRPRRGLRVRQETLTAEDVVVVGGISVTSPVRTAFDCLRWLRLPHGVVVADALAHASLISVDELSAYFGRHRGLRNLRIGAAQIPLIDPRSESPMETRLRIVAVVDAGLPPPVAQFEVFDRRGRFVARLDLAWPQLKLAAEYDGAFHWQQRREDDRRRDALRAHGWTVLVFSADDVFGNSLGLAAQLRNIWRNFAAA